MDNKIAVEVADQDFYRFIEAMDIDADLDKMTLEDRESFEQQKSKVVRAICNGSLVVNDKGEPVFTPLRSENQEPITFYEPSGASYMAMDRRKKNQDVGKLFTTMGDITKTSSARFANMKNADVKVCMAITTLFLA